MQIAQIREYSLIYGFEPSFVIWTQGCPLHCKGCSNEDTWSFTGGYEIDISTLLEKIHLQKRDKKFPINAVSILGGEPLVQYEEVLSLLKRLCAMDLGIILYTGYEIDEIYSMQKEGVFRFIDVLISGRYVESLRDTTLHLRGSSNQKIDFFTQRYNATCLKEGNYCEIEIDSLGRIDFFGYPDAFQREIKYYTS